ncbi:hypothetical protein [Pseudactinotalea sp. HY158]|uniref:hypothetical protein n=1 Tax=Pseudactinotalea sp. HY158 TaxID=2654547 RepID=UPI00129CAD65|nr:hypothetical protein [Pseudactinotalea sp. HY158]QGH70379.1 hypothetical protein GCE65_13420 [Pseudactinotalea sp. HY158]
MIEEVDEVRWAIRPSPMFHAIELCNVDGIIDACEGPPRISSWLLAENKWRPPRYGLEAIIILDEDGNEELVTGAVRRLVEQLAPVAEDLGCADELAGVLEILDGGASYQRQRAVAAAHGGPLDAVVAHAGAEFRAGRALPVP